MEGKVIKAIIYTDDGIARFRGFEIAKSVSELVRNDLLSAGFVTTTKRVTSILKQKENGS